MQKTAIILVLLLCLFTNCKEKYNPEIKSINQSYLVVDGNLNPSDTTFIHLSRTVPVDTSIRINPENGAVVTIEGSDNSIYPLSEKVNGTYILPSTCLSIGKQDR